MKTILAPVDLSPVSDLIVKEATEKHEADYIAMGWHGHTVR